MQKLTFEFNSTHQELCNAKQKMAAELVATADAVKFKSEASKARNHLQSRCEELEEENKLLQNEIQVESSLNTRCTGD